MCTGATSTPSASIPIHISRGILSPVIAMKRVSIESPNESKLPSSGLSHMFSRDPTRWPEPRSTRRFSGTISGRCWEASVLADASLARQRARVFSARVVHEANVPMNSCMPTRVKMAMRPSTKT